MAQSAVGPLGSNGVGAVYVNTSLGAGIDSEEIVSAVSGKRIRVLAFVLNPDDAGAFAFYSGTDESQVLTALGALANSTKTYPYNPEGWFETDTGEALRLGRLLASAEDYVGQVSYQVVSPA